MCKLSVVIINYKQTEFLAEAIVSALNIGNNTQVIVVDNASLPLKKEADIQNFKLSYPTVQWVLNQENIGHCKAFNQGLAIAEGDLIIDLAADDVLVSNAISSRIAELETLPERYAAAFSNAELVYFNGKRKLFFPHNQTVKEGYLLPELIKGHYLPSVSLIFRTAVLKSVGGYNELLSYEDYDILSRLAKDYEFKYQPLTSVLKRELPQSSSKQFYNREAKHLWSTLQVHKQIAEYPLDQACTKALAYSARYHHRLAVFLQNQKLADEYADFLQRNGINSITNRVLQSISKLRLPIYRLYKLRNTIRYPLTLQ